MKNHLIRQVADRGATTSLPKMDFVEALNVFVPFAISLYFWELNGRQWGRPQLTERRRAALAIIEATIEVAEDMPRSP